MWIVFAAPAAVFAALTSILAKTFSPDYVVDEMNKLAVNVTEMLMILPRRGE